MKPTIIIVMLFLFTFSAWAGTFMETFDDANLEAWREIIMFDFKINPDTWEIIDGELQGTNHDRLLRFLTMSDEKWRNYTIEFDVKPLEKHGLGNIGIAARINETVGVASIIGDWPFPLPGPDSHASCFGGDFQGNKFEVLNNVASPLLKLETWSTMKFQVNEETFTFWINGKQVLEAKDKAFHFPVGGAGLVLTAYTARFDNIVITGKGIPNKGRLSVSPRVKLATTWGSLRWF